MDFFRIVEQSFPGKYEIGDLRPSLFLPTVYFAQCGHTLSGANPLPLELPADSWILGKLSRAGIPRTINPEEWQDLRRSLAEMLTQAGHVSPFILPGVRVGPLEICVTLADSLPDRLPVGPYALYSGRLIDAIAGAGITGFDAFPAKVFLRKVGGDFGTVRYYEVLTTHSAPFSESAHLELTKCETCGLVETIRYKSLTIDEAQWDGADFVRVGETWATIVSERVKHAAESINATGIQFLPSSRIAVGPGAPSTTELLADLEFERQVTSRR